MEQYKNKLEIQNKGAFEERFNYPKEQLEAKYGLPAEVEFCTRCVISNQRPNSAVEFQHTAKSKKATINLDDEGVCDACRMAEQKKAIINFHAQGLNLRL